MKKPHLLLIGSTLAAQFGLPAHASATTPIQLSTFPAELEATKTVFDKYVEVFGLRVLATSGVSEAKTLHAANVLAEYLDNDEDGTIDQAEVLTALKGTSNAEIATMVLFASEQEQESSWSKFEAFESSLTRSQNLFAMEIFEAGSQGYDRDATLEEVLHLVTDHGWDKAFPDVWGEKEGTSIALAMDKARGGKFLTVPSSYPAGAWFTYYDATADYATQITEYVYWATTTYLGGQDWTGRVHADYTNEWKPITKSDLEASDPDVVTLLTSTAYKFPIHKLPDGNYSVTASAATYVRADATNLDTTTNWKTSTWFGTFLDSDANWIYHLDLGWLYPVDVADSSTWLYHADLGWLWTQKDQGVHPWVWMQEVSGWRYFSASTGFYDPGTQTWTTLAALAAQIGASSGG